MSANDIEHLIQTVCPSSGSLSIQRPEGKSYAFAELSSHENASVAMALLRDHFISLGNATQLLQAFHSYKPSILEHLCGIMGDNDVCVCNYQDSN
jgi:hypothetical protein